MEVVVGFVEVGVVLIIVSGVELVVGKAAVVVVAGAVEVDLDVVDVLQDVNRIDITMRQINTVQIVPLFIVSSYYLIKNFWEIDYYLILECSVYIQIIIGMAGLAPQPRLPLGLRIRRGIIERLYENPTTNSQYPPLASQPHRI